MTRTANRRCSPSAISPPSPTMRSTRRSYATPPPIGISCPVAGRPRGQQPLGARGARSARCSSRATARRGVRSCTSTTSRRRSSPRSAPRDIVHDKAFNVGPTTENYRVREVAEIVGPIVPGFATCSPEPPAPTRATTASRRRIAEQYVPPISRSGRSARRGPGVRGRVSNTGLAMEQLEGPGIMRIRTVRELPGPRSPRPGPALGAGCAGGLGCLTVAAVRAAPSELEVFLSLGKTPLADALVPPELGDSRGPRFPLEVAFCPSARSCSFSKRFPGQLFVDNYLYFSSFSDMLPAHARARPRPDREPRSRPGTAGRAPRATTVLSCRTSSSSVFPCSASIRRRTRAAAAERRGVPTLRAFFGSELAESAPQRGVQARRRDHRQQRDGARARPQRLRRRRFACCCGRRCCHDREPLRARPDRPRRVRHDLPRAPLLLLVHRSRPVVRATASI